MVALLQGEVARWQPGHGGRLRTRELAGDEHDDARSAARWLVCVAVDATPLAPALCGQLAAALASGRCPPPLVVVVARADGAPLPPLDAISRAAPAVLRQRLFGAPFHLLPQGGEHEREGLRRILVAAGATGSDGLCAGFARRWRRGPMHYLTLPRRDPAEPSFTDPEPGAGPLGAPLLNTERRPVGAPRSEE